MKKKMNSEKNKEREREEDDPFFPLFFWMRIQLGGGKYIEMLWIVDIEEWKCVCVCVCVCGILYMKLSRKKEIERERERGAALVVWCVIQKKIFLICHDQRLLFLLRLL